MRPSALPSPASAPSVLASSSTPTSTSVKRALPTSSQSATEPSSAKRHRPSLSTSSYPSTSTSAADADSTRPRRTASKSTPAAPRSIPASSSAPAVTQTNGGAKGALLSPSQKRANHIQSEQKRRANIRRGYEALCETVPALREAIRAEEERERTKELEEEASAKSKVRGGSDKGKKKKKSEGEKADGRAGPRSENVVLQKTIDYIEGLLAERVALRQRLELARGMLPPTHPALPVDPRHMDSSGVPLWEREWNGGMDLDATAGAGDEGSEDEG
ncbi:hypothetical protein K466DRAFT_496917 [Polyporus arcularius HHB13444]|uniref:BHLH domain-containing protein n=1 Tax=Polyporus arcularius HHB13444 TaxID=1314778 RepID=A0A5C3P5G9_9APHY|nr:hypothetical protein K466DRAFT_496917 [Polyporus arcularius HHB13444]